MCKCTCLHLQCSCLASRSSYTSVLASIPCNLQCVKRQENGLPAAEMCACSFWCLFRSNAGPIYRLQLQAYPVLLDSYECNDMSQVYPTKVRSFALGCNNALSRFGAILAPYLAVDLAQRGSMGAALTEGIIAGMCLIAAACVFALPLETSGQPLQVYITASMPSS